MSKIVYKEFIFVYEDGPLSSQEDTDLFKLSCVLADYIADNQDDSSLSDYVSLAKRMVDFISSDNIRFITK